MNLLIQNAELYAPERLGRRDILCCSGRIAAIAEGIEAAGLPFPCDTLDAGGRPLVPGFIDGHVHVTGGGGEGGFRTRTPELSIADTLAAGVTTVLGMLGTDGIARSVEALVAKTYALREAGLSAWCLTGSYRVPVTTVTGDAAKDIMMIEPVIGIGEIAVSDHRSSKPGVSELARLASEARVAGMLAGKAGVLVVHVGDAPAGLGPLEAALSSGDLPRRQFIPTHCNRNRSVLDQALLWASSGGWIDLTAGAWRSGDPGGGLSAARAFAEARGRGCRDRATISSDGQGSLPVFDDSGALAALAVGSCESLAEALREMVLELGIPLEEALLPVTSTPARALGLARKGRIEPGFDADALILDAELRPSSVVARGRILVRSGELEYRDVFAAPARSGSRGKESR